MDFNQGVLSALKGPGWANPEIQKSSLGQPQGSMGVMENLGNELQQGFQNSKLGQYLENPNNPLGKAFGQLEQRMPQFGQMGQMFQQPMGMLGQPPQMNRPTGTIPPVTQPQPPSFNPPPATMPNMTPYGGGMQATPYGSARGPM